MCALYVPFLWLWKEKFYGIGPRFSLNILPSTGPRQSWCPSWVSTTTSPTRSPKPTSLSSSTASSTIARTRTAPAPNVLASTWASYSTSDFTTNLLPIYLPIACHKSSLFAIFIIRRGNTTLSFELEFTLNYVHHDLVKNSILGSIVGSLAATVGLCPVLYQVLNSDTLLYLAAYLWLCPVLYQALNSDTLLYLAAYLLSLIIYVIWIAPATVCTKMVNIYDRLRFEDS